MFEFLMCLNSNAVPLGLSYNAGSSSISILAVSMLAPTKETKLNPILLKVIIISVLVHVVAAFVAGVVTIATHVMQEDAQFEEPPAVQEEEPPKEVKVVIKPQRPKQAMPMSHLQMRPVANISVAAVDVDLPSMGDSFTVSAGLGNGGGRLNLGNMVGAVMRFPDIKGFGTTKKVEHAWEGTVYLFDKGKLLRLRNKQGDWFTRYKGDRKGKRQTAKIYNYSLNLPRQDFTKGFPGVTDQFEWFAIDFELALYWPESLAGEYEFRVESDDGSILTIDGEIVIDNDGQHAMVKAEGRHEMEAGRRKFRLAYFQGPATAVGLILEYRKAGETEWKIFNTTDLIKYQM